MKRNSISNKTEGSVIVVAVMAVTLLALLAGNLLQMMISRHNVTYQTAAWQEARMAAEALIDRALQDLNTNATDPVNGTWTGWTSSDGSPKGSVFDINKASAVNPLADGGGLLVSDEYLYIDNAVFPVSSSSGRSAVADAEIRALYPDATAENAIWFRVRAMGTAGVQGHKIWAAPFAEDTALRKLNMTRFRPAKFDLGTKHTELVALPNASRMLEAIIRPRSIFDVAIHTEEHMIFGNSNGPFVDSYNSNEGPYAGPYPDDDTAHQNGHIASNGQNVAEDEYEIVINKVRVKGNVYLHSGTHKASYTSRDNITGDITSGYDNTMEVIPAPSYPWATPSSKTDFAVNGTMYYTTPDLAGFKVSGTGKLVILVTGNWNTGSGNGSRVEIPDSVKVEVWVGGNIDFGNGDINVRPDGTIGNPPNLLVFGTGASGNVQMHGNPNMSMALYAPSYDFTLKGGGNGSKYGAIVVKTMDLRGGGKNSFHYDEALKNNGRTSAYVIASYIEDWRK